MARIESVIYFRFQVWWLHSFKEMKVYLHIKFRWYISVRGWNKTTSGLGKRTATVLELYLRFRFWSMCSHWHAILHLHAKFRSNQTKYAERRSIDFLPVGQPPVLHLLRRRFWVFLTRRGDKIHGLAWNLARCAKFHANLWILGGGVTRESNTLDNLSDTSTANSVLCEVIDKWSK